MQMRRLLVLVGLVAGFGLPADVRGYDMDCKVILCLAAGFPAGCQDARSYMLDRLRSRPPKPPFGHCEGTDGDDFRLTRGYERYFPCVGGFTQRSRSDSDSCHCIAITASARTARALRNRALAATGATGSRPRVLAPSREQDRSMYHVVYSCHARARPRWLQIRLRTHDDGFYVSERFWWR